MEPPMRFFRFTLQILMVILQAGLTVWVMCMP